MFANDFRWSTFAMQAVEESINGVLAGSDGYLFLSDGGHHVLDYAIGRRQLSDRSIINFQENIENRARIARNIDAKYLHMIVPDKQSVLGHHFPFPVSVRLGEICCDRISDSATVTYPRALLESMPPPAYLRTDTHLTNAASIQLATHIAELCTGQMLTKDCDFLLSATKTVTGFSGDLATKLTPSPSEDIKAFAGSWPSRWLHNGSFGGNNGIVDIRFNFEPKFEKRVVVFGDSFGRDLAWFLSYFFGEVLFLRTPYLHEEIVRQTQPDIVITENSERYLEDCRLDAERPCFLMYPFLSGHACAPSVEFAEAFSAMLSFPRPPYWAFRERIRKIQSAP